MGELKMEDNYSKAYKEIIEILNFVPKEKAKEKYEKIKSDSTIDRKELRLEIAQKTINTKKNALEQIENQLEFLRPSSQEDMNYRLKQYNEFSEQVKSEVPDDLHLCFHGCPIYAAKQIIKDGEISSSVDRIGSETSYDVSDQVLASHAEQVNSKANNLDNLSSFGKLLSKDFGNTTDNSKLKVI